MTKKEIITELIRYKTKFWIELMLSDVDDINTHLTDMNILHGISLKVVGQLISLYSEEDSAFDFENDMKVTDVKGKIVSAMFKDKNQDGEYIDLATSLVEAIQFINQHKA
jgi:predicted nucleic acid-binding OB-fold protein